MKAIAIRKREKFLDEIKTKGDVAKNSAIGTLRDVGVGVVGGGLLGSLVGRHSFLVGLATSFGGYYFANRTASSLGMGMMAANGFQASRTSSTATTQGLEGFDMKQEMENAKQRVINFRDNFSEKLYLDKLMKKEMGDLGEVDYYLHGEIGDDQDALEELDRIETQLIQSAEEFESPTGSLNDSGSPAESSDNGELMDSKEELGPIGDFAAYSDHESREDMEDDFDLDDDDNY